MPTYFAFASHRKRKLFGHYWVYRAINVLAEQVANIPLLFCDLKLRHSATGIIQENPPGRKWVFIVRPGGSHAPSLAWEKTADAAFRKGSNRTRQIIFILVI